MPQPMTKGTICSPQLKSFLKTLDSYTERIPLSVLRSGLEALSITVKDLQDFVRFRKERYQRNLIHQGPAYQALLLCWRNGQRSPIHDHRGSSCGVLILEGVTYGMEMGRMMLNEPVEERCPGVPERRLGIRGRTRQEGPREQDADLFSIGTKRCQRLLG